MHPSASLLCPRQRRCLRLSVNAYRQETTKQQLPSMAAQRVTNDDLMSSMLTLLGGVVSRCVREAQLPGRG